MNNNVTIGFTYDVSMEFDNLHRGMNSLNRKSNSDFTNQMIDSGVDVNDHKAVDKYARNEINQRRIDTDKITHSARENWDKISDPAIERLNKLFEALPVWDVTVYLTLNDRCAYNFQQKYFFVYLDSPSTNSIIIHELLHFYTYEYFTTQFTQKGISYENFNDYKEALTFIINTNFSDLIDGYFESGYKKQEKLRQQLEKMWPECSTIIELTNKYLTQYYK